MNVTAYMEKYGWKPGMGLGKDNSGIAEHIRVSKKANKRGIGMDSAKTFEPWWEKLYNKTAQQSINGSKKDDSSSTKEKEKEKKEEKEPQKGVGQLRVLGARLAPMFVRGTTLDLSKTQEDKPADNSSSSSSSSDSDSDSSDDELVRPISTSKDTFEALGRRTGKKYSAGGKLSRLEAQEKKWNLIRSNSVSPALSVSNSTSPAPQVSNSTSPAPEGEKKRKREEKDEEENKESGDAVGEPEKKKKKKEHRHHHHHHHKKDREAEEDNNTESGVSSELHEEKKKKEKKEKKDKKKEKGEKGDEEL